MRHKNNLNDDKMFTKRFFRILSPDFPEFLQEYIATPAMQRLKPNSISCGCNYTDLFDVKFKYSNLSHSIGVALIVWHFTRDKKATLAGLFHDIANPSFKHCIDFMNGDYEKQESIDERMAGILTDSKEIMRLLRRDKIATSDVLDFAKYPIADNDTPQLSADRLEYTLANGYFWLPVWTMAEIKEIYDGLTVAENENGVPELTFRTLEIAEKFVAGASKLWPSWIDDKDKITMQFIADTMRKMSHLGLITVDDLYEKSETEIIDIIKNCDDKKIREDFEKFQNLTECRVSTFKVAGKYCRSIKAKRRYVVPLVVTKNGAERITKLSQTAKCQIDRFLKMTFAKYVWLDIDE
ncbi:MAG: hypothetical protein LBQ02_03375 [Candidatus Nomurabacteria bacterium]|jgi:HD superfamily phosphohydrolase|nr:hypothetical protein [Candidatus Nomurabacteria bacterium]